MSRKNQVGSGIIGRKNRVENLALRNVIHHRIRPVDMPRITLVINRGNNHSGRKVPSLHR